MYPAFLQHILLPLGSYFFSGNYSRYLNEWKRYDRMTPESLHTLQQERLDNILAHARDSVPFYMDLPASAKLKDFPILTKAVLYEAGDTLLSKGEQKRKLIKNHSSGSSGLQSVTYMTKDHSFYLRALQTHWWSWGGYRPGEPLLQAGMSLKRGFVKNLKDFFFRVHYMDAFQLTEENISAALHNMPKTANKHLAGYPSALNEIARTAISLHGSMPFRSVISYGDKLFDQHISNFNKGFEQPTIINTYGCAEGLLMACKADLPYYYIMSPHVYLEILDDEGEPVAPGKRGQIVVTGLTNYAMPLIRYQLGDLGVMLPKERYPETKKYPYPLLQEVTGRETDIIHSPNGNVLIVHSFTGILEYYTKVSYFKILHTAPDAMKLEYSTWSGYPLEDVILDEIRERILKLTDHSMTLEVEWKKEVPRSPSGKPQIIERVF